MRATKVSVFGARGSFSEEAALKEFKKVKLIHCATISQALKNVKKEKSNYAVVPIENSLEGIVGETLDWLTFNDGVKIFKEIVLPIRHCLLGFSRSKIRTIVSHPQALAQCREWMRKNLKNAKLVAASSTSEAAKQLAKTKDETVAVIASERAAKLYKLKILEEIPTDNNFTRFLVVAKKDHRATGYDKTSIVFYSCEDRPGILWETLGEFAKRKINLTKIESRPSKKALGDYLFYIDFEGHRSEKRVIECLEAVRKKVAFLKVLGSYPRCV
jgi:prephenate dehydratase